MQQKSFVISQIRYIRGSLYPVSLCIIKSAQDPDEDLTDTTDKDNDEQESMKISMDMGLEYGTKFLAFLEQQGEEIN